jgi:adenylate cyclase
MDQADHAQRALDCALEMDAVSEQVRQRVKDRLEVGITRIGVNSGTAIVGNFGGEDYFDYTAHGDAINTAARLENANKQLGTRICVSGETVSRLDSFHGRPAGHLLLRGKHQGVEVYEVFSEEDMPTEMLESYLDAFQNIKNQSPQALDRIAMHCERYPEDALARFHWQRLQAGEAGVEIDLT